MKLVAVILSFFIFSMSVFPCGDISTSSDEDITHDANHGIDGEHHHHTQNGDDDCTPFCMCDCCSIPITISFVKPIPHNEIVHQTTISFHYNSTYKYTFTTTLWQPPKQC